MNEIQRQAEQLADMDRRIRQLEGGQRSGLSSIVADHCGNVTMTPPYGISQWQNLGGAAPTVTATTGRRVLMMATATFAYVGMATTGLDLRCRSVELGIGIDATDPQFFAGMPMSVNVESLGADSAGSHLALYGTQTICLQPQREDLVPGEHTFRLLLAASDVANPTGTVHPVIRQASLIVIPLGFG